VTALPLPSAVPASLWLRLLAAVYDLLPLLALAFLATVLALAVTAGTLDVSRPLHRRLRQALVLALVAGYFVLSWMRGGQTLGMRPWRLRVVRADGGAVSARQALLRFGMALLSLAPAGLGFWWALFDERRRTWHDLATGTLVVQLERKSAS
jgi:uncharacterized RDD family membrane protein YckC